MIITLVASIGMSLWSFFSDKNAEDKKQTELLRQATAKNAEDVVRDNNESRYDWKCS